jgi:hypothetical protein
MAKVPNAHMCASSVRKNFTHNGNDSVEGSYRMCRDTILSSAPRYAKNNTGCLRTRKHVR